MILSTGEDNALRVACGATGIEDVGDIIHRCLLLDTLHLRLTGQALAQLHEGLETHGGGVGRVDGYQGIEDDDTLQRLTGGENTLGLVILLLFANEEKTYLGIVDHELDLLF